MSTGRLPSVDGGIQPTIVDAKGDLIVATAADTVSRLAVGSNDQVLTADSTTATGLKWAAPSSGGMTLLSTTTLSGATTTISSISGSYTNLLILVDGVNNNNNFGDYGILPNNSSVSSGNQQLGDTPGSFSSTAIPLTMGSTTGASSTNRNWAINIYNYASSTQQKTFSVNGYNRTQGCWANGTFQSTTAISSLVFTTFGTGSFTAGTVLLYGVK